MTRFEDPKTFFHAIYQDTAPWDIGRMQPSLAQLLDTHSATSPALDLGCGTGDVALELARRGIDDVLGIDIAPTAIEQARAKLASSAQVFQDRVRFEVADALRPSELGLRFETVVDCGFLHVLEPASRDVLMDEVHAILRPGGRYYLLAFAIDFELPNTPHAIRAEEIQERFSDPELWTVREVREAQFHSRVAPPVPAVAACVERV